MPSGEVFTGPLEDSAEGRIRFTIPTAPRGVDVADVDAEFRDGRVVRARAERGDEYLGRRSTPTPAPAASASSGSARTSASTARSARSCSTRRSAARSTSRSAAPTPRPAAERVRRPLGPDLRPAPRRPPDRRRRGGAGGRQLLVAEAGHQTFTRVSQIGNYIV